MTTLNTADDTSTFTGEIPPSDRFPARHHGQRAGRLKRMLDTVGAGSLDELVDEAVPGAIRLREAMGRGAGHCDWLEPMSEAAALAELRGIAERNVVARSMIGMGYHGTLTPPVILRNIIENPLWYTPYTPYQAEISQGRLEALLNYQTMVCSLTGMAIANASLLDEETAAAEAMAMCHGIARGKKPLFLVGEDCHPQTIEVVKTRAGSMGVAVQVCDLQAASRTADLQDSPDLQSKLSEACGVLVQSPNTHGRIVDYSGLCQSAHAAGALVVAATDLLACCLVTPPGEWASDSEAGGADIVLGSSQRFGVPMGYGGPHAAFFATREQHTRKMPGRLVGVSKDAMGAPAYRLTIQTREQHIKRDKATSNICTAQVLLANVAGFYAVWHGPEGLQRIAREVNAKALWLADRLRDAGLGVPDPAAKPFFDTFTLEAPGRADDLVAKAREAGVNLRTIDADRLGISVDEATTPDDMADLVEALTGERTDYPDAINPESPVEDRTSDILTHPVFHEHHSEHEFLRYVTRLQGKDLSLANSMIPLGSCTMKLNAAAEMIPVTWPQFANMHPYAPADQARGYAKLFEDLEKWLCEITGFAAVSLQPNAGSQGEYAGLLAIRRYHLANEGIEGAAQPKRHVCLIPTSAHGTNPASAVIAGMKVVAVKCDQRGDIDTDDLRAKCEQHADTLAALMITYPSTHGVFEAHIRDICALVHEHGGLVYMDGANMNAQVGLTSPGHIGADVCHLNLHKTFCIPHGGGGPGMGPIGVNEKLKPYLPGDPLGRDRRHGGDAPISAAPFGSPMILPISWMYIRMMGTRGLTEATQRAILNADYMATRLRGHYDVLYTGANGRVAHEFILDCRPFEKAAGVTVEDIAKRLMDFGFHAPTMSWPVAGTLMIEPTESESKEELDRFCDAMIQIRREIEDIEKAIVQGSIQPEPATGEAAASESAAGTADTTEADAPPAPTLATDSPLKNAPHPAARLLAADWPHPYSRNDAAYPLPWVRERKYWPPVARIDNPYGDRNLVCTCPSVTDICEI